MATKHRKSPVEAIKNTTHKINKQLITVSDSLVEETLATGEQWQNVFAKALKSGTILFAKQTDLTLDVIEGVKKQFDKSSQRFRQLISFDMPEAKTEKSKAKTKAKTQTTSAKKRLTKIASKVAKEDAAIKEASAKSDLKIIEGIGPKLESILNENGIYTFDQLANAKVETLKSILEKAGSRYNMHDPTTWTQQAQLAAAGKMDELVALQKELKGGKPA